jgi:hypothetical protein
MQKPLIAAFLIVSFVVPVLAAETFYVIFDNTLKGCTVLTAEPSDKGRYKVLGTYNIGWISFALLPLLLLMKRPEKAGLAIA